MNLLVYVIESQEKVDKLCLASAYHYNLWLNETRVKP